MKKVGLTYIVDDDYIFRIIATKMLEAHPSYLHSKEFQGGESAIQSLKALQQGGQPFPDLILLDIDMPIMNAWEFLEVIKSIPGATRIPIVAVSSSINPADLQRADTHPGIMSFIPKPLSDKRLTELANSL